MSANKGNNNYQLTNILGTISIFPIHSFEIKTGLGLTPVSIGDYSTTALSLPVDINYYLPVNISGFLIALNLHAQRAFGYPPTPGSEKGDATDFIYFGLLIKTPLGF